MATTRLVVVLLVLGTVLLLLVQNTATALPVVFLGSRTLALPVGVWLAGAIGLGALTTLVLTALLRSIGGSGSGGPSNRRYKYEPQAFYEPTDSASASRGTPQPGSTPPRSSPSSSAQEPDGRRRSPNRPVDFSSPSNTAAATAAATDGTWQAWADLQSPTQWESWDAGSRPPQPETRAYSPPPTPQPTHRSSFNWFGRRDNGGQTQQVEESLQEITEDWGDLERRRYRASGVSPVEESLEELTQGWDDIEPQDSPPLRDFEAPQSPKQVYRDGSIYSYSYRDRASAGQTDRIYAPPDDRDAEDPYVQDRYAEDSYVEDQYAEDPYTEDPYTEDRYYDDARPSTDIYRPDDSIAAYDDNLDEDDLADEELEEEGVVDADFRVLIPPYNPPPDEDIAPSPTAPPATDGDWDDTDDALTP